MIIVAILEREEREEEVIKCFERKLEEVRDDIATNPTTNPRAILFESNETFNSNFTRFFVDFDDFDGRGCSKVEGKGDDRDETLKLHNSG